ncbi:acetoacetyl-coenzyme A synthetase [Candidatus Scalindua japonica]|uniref:Acetoacetyl-coenzyme A synthetase n=1 Tax=Candidatus Scalindua japonica TaxID=1284222 RepID=A0A286TYL7_9BACT|nr:hypothetical protein [Candidatus Scalindua japonica]GAX60970.1 acetoacetyl-coenzyme A synthetase [Candidatus Scalindua japonica]
MKYKDLVKKLTYVPNDGYFNSHYSPETHGTGEYNQFAYTTVGTCECPKCIAHALAFGITDHYQDHEITEEIVTELKAIYGVYGIDNLKAAFKEEDKDSPEMFKSDGELNLSE